MGYLKKLIEMEAPSDGLLRPLKLLFTLKQKFTCNYEN